MLNSEVKKIFDSFQVYGTFKDGKPYGSGHINDTFLVRTEEEHKPDYIFQRINGNIFKDVPGLMENIRRVTGHIRMKLKSIPGSDPDRQTLTLVPAKTGKVYHVDEEGRFWRCYIFIDNSLSYDIVDSKDKAYEGGKAFGRFQRMLADIPEPPLNPTIPYFHDIEKRLATFHQTIKDDVVGRKKNVEKEIEFVEQRIDDLSTVHRLAKEKKIPERITHNDTKFNNVLLDKNNKALCVIDLDTVMPGLVHFDFGDSIRTATNTAAEDEAVLEKISINLDLFEGYASGFLSETSEILMDIEKDYLAFSAKLMTYIVGVRFLTDYLDGDKYFKIKFPEHNLQRARAQFKLLSSMEENFEKMKGIIEKYAGRTGK